MKNRGTEATMRRWATIIVTLLAMTGFLVPITQAADMTEGRSVYHTLKAELKEVGDVPGHMVGEVHAAGLGFFTKGPASGQIATRMSTAQVDTVKGKGTFTNRIVYTFRDGSTLIHQATGTATPIDGGKRVVFEGTYEAISGTGKFAGVKGKGTFTGERLGSPETGGDSYADFTGNY